MQEMLASDIRSRWEYEGNRTSPPEGFPKFPDLPLGRYTDEGLYEAEISEVFKRRWLTAGHLSEYREPGSYRVLDLPFAPVVVVRGKDGIVRAFMNSCRHRGAPVVRERSGTAPLLVCQYHSWSYDLTGKLLRTPGGDCDFVGLMCEERGLSSVRCETWGGFVFVNLDPDAAPLLDDLTPLVPRFEHLVEAPLVHIDTKSYDLNCNWKIVIEAFMEVYHIKTVHSRTVAQVVDPPRCAMQLHPNGHSSMSVPFRPELLQAGEQGDMNWTVDVPTIPGISEVFQLSNTSCLVFPNSIFAGDANGFPVITAWPLGTGRTRMDVAWYGVDWGGGPRPDAWDIRLAGFDLITLEDIANMDPMQESIRAAAHKGAPLNYQERRLWQFHVDIDKTVGQERVPSELRVPDLLADYIEP